jgi:exoribonuclease R
MAFPVLSPTGSSLDGTQLATGLLAIRAELKLPTSFAPEVEAAAVAARPAGGVLPPGTLVGADARADRTAIEFVTLDPLGSKDLDQAFAIEPDGDGHTLHYAIADVAAHLIPGGPIDAESRRRGETLYLPDGRIPLHPFQLSEGAASLLPEVERLAVVWSLSIDAAGELVGTHVERATVRSRVQLDYRAAEEALAAGTAHPQLVALAQLGPLLQGAARRRGAIELPEPAQELVAGADGGWALSWVPRAPIEDWNAQLSLTTGRAAAALMLQGKAGLLRTLPPAPNDALPRLRVTAAALRVEWPADETLPDRLARLDPTQPADLALIDQSRILLRGAGYLPVDGTEPAPAEALHAAVAAPYAHVTAPLRRLGDRFATECALANYAGEAVPAWAREALPELPGLLVAGGRLGGSVGRAVLDLAEAIVLAPRLGQRFEAAIIEVGEKSSDVRLEAPPILARCDGRGLTAGTRATIELTAADPIKRTVRFNAIST